MEEWTFSPQLSLGFLIYSMKWERKGYQGGTCAQVADGGGPEAQLGGVSLGHLLWIPASAPTVGARHLSGGLEV